MAGVPQSRSDEERSAAARAGERNPAGCRISAGGGSEGADRV